MFALCLATLFLSFDGAHLLWQDLHKRQRDQQGLLDLNKAVAVAETTIKLWGAGLQSLITNPRDGATAIALVGGFATVIYGSREGFKLVRARLEAILGRPALVRETSRTGLRGMCDNLVNRLTGRTGKITNAIFHPSLENRLQALSTATANTKKNKAPFRHVVMYGPPGTGKTLVAKQLAKYSGLDYAIMSGGDVAPLREHAVTEIHNLFRWAESSQKGLILFIDEAEAFLKTRNDPDMSEHARNALNALLCASLRM
jgi:ATPase family AAA domain-containing protein 3A/B